MAADGARELPDLLSESDAMISALLAGRAGSGIRMTNGIRLMRDVFDDAGGHPPTLASVASPPV